jgi:hypothetical protein
VHWGVQSFEQDVAPYGCNVAWLYLNTERRLWQYNGVKIKVLGSQDKWHEKRNSLPMESSSSWIKAMSNKRF